MPESSRSNSHGEELRISLQEVIRRSERDAVILKPAGLSSEAPGDRAVRPGGRAPATLLAQVTALLGWKDAQLPHRLDRPTRGFVVVARDKDAVRAHNESIRAGRWVKRYIARIAPIQGGNAPALIGEHRAYLRQEGAMSRVVRSGGDPSLLTIEAVAPAPGRVNQFHAVVLLGTGRYHQIRAMLSNLGFPLVGDFDYGGGDPRTPTGNMYLDHAWLSYPCLEGSELEGSEMVRVWQPVDPGREALDETIVQYLQNAV